MKDVLRSVIPNNRIYHVLELIGQEEGGQVERGWNVGVASVLSSLRWECIRISKGSLENIGQEWTPIGPSHVGTDETTQRVDAQMTGKYETIGFIL